MCFQKMLDCIMSLAPFSGGSILAQEQHAKGSGSDENERDNERNAPCLGRCQAAIFMKSC